jgi:hypothetical protein
VEPEWAGHTLAFARLTNDGDDEGAVFLGRMPSKAEAEAIRRYCRILRKRDLSDTAPSEAQLAARAAFADRRRAQLAARAAFANRRRAQLAA